LHCKAANQTNLVLKSADFRAYSPRVEAKQTAFKDYFEVLRLRVSMLNKEVN